MVQAKSELFEEILIESANLFKALSHPARLHILKFLAESKSCITGDISNELPLGRTTVNQHIKELKEVGLIKGETEGAKTKYCLNVEKIKELKFISQDFFDKLNTESYSCK